MDVTKSRIAYIISCYKLPDQLIQLVNAIWHENDIFLIHIDKKSPKAYHEKIRGALSARENIIYLRSHLCNWGDFGHVKVTLKGISYLAEGQDPFTNLVVLTGQDLPIHTLNRTRHQIIQAGNSISYFPLPTQYWLNRGLDRVNEWHFWIRGRHYSLKNSFFESRAKSALKKLDGQGEGTFYGGSSYFQLEREPVHYIYTLLRRKPYIVSFFKHTYISDEFFFQSILMNSKFKNQIKNDDMRYIDWTDPNESPKILRMEDLPKIRASKAIFARKFDASVDPRVINYVLGRGKK